VDALAAVALVACLVLILIWTSRRWGPPRLYIRGRLALWLVAAMLTLIVVAFALR
jgi:hypothetical protein